MNNPSTPLFSDERRELLARLLQEKGMAGGAGRIARCERRAEPAPTSYAQQRLWFLDQLQPGGAVYNIPLAMRFNGALDVQALEQTLAEIVRRHEVLRTTFAPGEGDPVQVIHAPGDFKLLREDLRTLEAAARADAVQGLASAEATRPFDLTQGPLLRAILIQTAADEHVLLLTLHHIVADGWSIGVLIREVAALYPAFTSGQPSPLPDLPLQYADFAHWQRQWLRDEVLARQLAYWTEQLKAPLPVLELPCDRPRPEVQTYRGAHHPLHLPAPLAADLRALSRRVNGTLYMTLLAAFQVLLYRYTGQTDLVLGTPIANRNRAEIEGLIGFFVNTLVLRTDLAGNPRFTELLARVQAVTTQAYAHQDLPFEKLVETLQPVRDARRSPLFQVMFDFMNTPLETLTLPRLALTPLDQETSVAKFDLTLYVEEYAGRLRAQIEYNTDLFEASTVARMGEQWVRLLDSIVADPGTRIDALPLLSAAERAQLLVNFNDSARDYPRDLSLVQLFEAQAAARPEAVALIDGEQRLSYAQLNARANQLAHYLIARGVGPEMPVALCLERSALMVVGLLGILKAGGAYVPLDPDYPSERLDFMLKDAQAPLLITQEALAARLPADLPVLRLDTQWPEIAFLSSANPRARSEAGHLAYIIYTSGSTGKPKGTMVCHRAITRLVFDTHYLPLAPDDVIAQASNIAFDAATFEIWTALLHGVPLSIVSKEQLLSAHALAATLQRQGIRVLFLTTALFNQLVQAVPTAFTHLRHLLFGGEAVDVQWVRALLAHGAPQRLLHVYGPTETTTFATWYLVQAIARDDVTVPIGRPIANTRCYVLDAALNPVPLGAAGELYIGGDALARGYLNRPELTAERFIPDPFGGFGERLYKTGDRVRYLSGGNLEFLGRVDHQVKLRGFRIELGEIEQALARHPQVREALVQLREARPGDPRLVAYVVCAQDASCVDADSLRTHLRRQLPDYMIPAAFVTLAALPLNANGKVNRQALPAPQWDAQFTPAAYVAPRTEAERIVAGVFAEVLGLEHVGVHENFFDLGGHSLKATHAITRLRQALKMDVPLRALFEHPTVADLAACMHADRNQGRAADDATLAPIPRQAEYPLSHAQKRLWFLAQLEPDSPFYNIPWAVLLEGELQAAAFERALQAVFDRHDALRTTFRFNHGEPVQAVVPPLPLALAFTDWSTLAPEEAERAARAAADEEAQRPFDLEHGPLFRCALFKLGERRHLLLITLHHIIADGWSMGVLVQEVRALYPAFCQGHDHALPALALQYADYVHWQNALLNHDALKAQETYWLAKLGGELPRLDLPADFPRPAVQTYRGVSKRFVLEATLAQDLKHVARRYDATLFMLLLAAFKVLLSKLTQQTDLLVGTPVAGRRDPRLETLIGFFVNTLVFRSDLSGDPPFTQTLARLKDTALEAWAHQDYPFDQLIEKLNPVRDLSRHPVFTVMFTFQNEVERLRDQIEFGGLKARGFGSGYRNAKFDLTLFVAEEAGDLALEFEYSTDLFKDARIEAMFAQYARLLRQIAARPQARLSELSLLSAEQYRQLVHDWNATSEILPAVCIHELFEAQVRARPQAVALVDGHEHLSYRELDARANRLAHTLRACGVGPDQIVGILLERSSAAVVAMLGILKAGGAYLPLNPDYPEARLRLMLADTRAAVLVTAAAHIKRANRLQWELPQLHTYICLDAVDLPACIEQADTENDKKLWDYVAERSTNAINASGWMNSYTGEDFSAEEMGEYVRNVVAKLAPYLHPHTRILEIGCGSGLSMFELAPRVGHYYGTDLSERIIEKDRAAVAARGLQNVTLQVLAAEDIASVAAGDFDIVILNSVVQLFPGHFYLRRVLQDALAKLKPQGVIFVGDVMDLRRKSALCESLADFKKTHAGKGYRTKTEWDHELFLDADYFHDLAADIDAVAAVECSEKLGTIDNELKRFRYDVILKIDRTAARCKPAKRKHQRGRRDIEGARSDPPALLTTPDHRAQVLYTSGSTGKPKGVEIVHRGVVRLVSHTDYARFTPDEVFLQLSPLTFDASTFEIWAALLNGGRLVLGGDELLLPHKLAAFLQASKVTTLFLTTALFNQLVETAPQTLSGLKRVFFGGEAVSPPHVLKAVAHSLQHGLMHAYGPTENSTYSTVHAVGTPAAPAQDALPVIPIGRPIAHSEAYLLDRHLNPVPVGVAGELYVGGAGLARGYVDRPDLTAEKFIPNPFSERPGARLYRTGDCARYLADGAIEFLGRIDEQVKIRGHRIELGEIEATLAQHPAIGAVAVLARADHNGDKRLVAYYAASAPLPVSELRAYLHARLPAYLVPGFYIHLPALPLTVHGKINKAALPAPDGTRPDLGAAYVAPRTETERVVARVFAEVLGLEQVGIRDNFFDLGGHSLKATQVISRLNKLLSRDVLIRTLFAHPTVAALARALQHDGAHAGIDYRDIAVLPAQDLYAASHAQQRLWFLAQLDPESPYYNMWGTLLLEGALDLAALQKTLRALTARHEALRTGFVVKDGKPFQRIAADANIDLAVEDLSSLPAEQRRYAARALARREASAPFDLSAPPLLRARLIRLAEGEHIFLFVLHHIISDGWSMGVLMRELGSLYRAFSTGQEPLLPALPVRYVDFAHWQNTVLAERLQAQERYWRGVLGGELPVLSLPNDFPRPAVRSYRGATETATLAADLGAALNALSQQHHLTLFMTLNAAFNALLWKLCGDEDIILGTPIANRNHIDLEGVVGFFVNTLVLRTRLSGGLRFTELLQQVKEKTLDAYAHQDYPFDKLIDVLNPVRDMGRTPVFSVMFALQNAMQSPDVAIEAGALRLQSHPLLENELARFDLMVSIFETHGRLTVAFEYNTDLFRSETVRAWMRAFEVLLQGIVARPDAKLSALPVLAPEDRRTLLVDANARHSDYPRTLSIPAVFERQVEETPEHVALVFADTRLTYRELNQRANRLAHYLIERGVQANMPVAIAMRPSPETLIAVLAILKAGAAYLYIDLDYPPARIAQLLAHARATLLLTAGERPALDAPVHIIDLPLEAQALARLPSVNPPTSVPAQALAYVVYTSGSTGQPKGVAVSHRNVVRLVKQTNYIDLTPSDRVLQASTIAFDAATFEIWGAWLNGAQLVVVAREDILTPGRLAGVIAQHGITVAWLTASLFNQIVDTDAEKLAGLRKLLVGGEALSVAHVRKAFAVLGPGKLINGYGPTENTTFSSCYPIDAVPARAGAIPIGSPIANSTAYILDRDLEPVVIGAVGELYVGGDGLAHGYLYAPALTAEKFIPDPFAGAPGSRLYRTGDLVRRLPDGNIDFVGRVDHQLKIRGHRIEPGEIERAVAAHPAVRAAAVIAREDRPGDKRLVAYIVVQGERLPTAGELRGFIKKTLPDYLVPSAFVFIDALPLTPNGKLNHKALPAPDHLRPDLEHAYVAPRTETERTLVRLWEEVLGLEKIGVHDDFFALGGHSLLATQLVSRLRHGLHLKISLRDLFETSSVAALAERIAAGEFGHEGGASGRVPPSLAPVARSGPLPASFAQQRLWLLDRLEPGNPFYNIAAALRLRGTLDVAALERTLDHIVQRHEALRTTFADVDGMPVQVIAPALKIEVPRIDLRALPEDAREGEVKRRLEGEAQTAFDLKQGPLIRAALLALQNQEHILLVTIHHIVSDGWSMGVIVQEMAALYDAYSQGAVPQLPPLPVQYADFASWQRQWLSGEVLEQQLGYWRERIGGDLPVIDLFGARAQPAARRHRGAMVPLQLPPDLSEALKALSRREGATLFMTLLAAYKTLLHRYTGLHDIIVGSPIANRNRAEIEGLIGFFVNMLVLRTDLDGDPAFTELLARVRQVAIGAFAHQDLPFEKLVEALHPERNLTQTPLFQVAFVLQNTPMSALQLHGLSLTPLSTDNGTSKFDLTLCLWDAPEGLRGYLEYDTDLYEAAAIARLAKHYQTLLKGIVAQPQARLSALPMLTQAETRAVSQSRVQKKWSGVRRRSQ